MLYASILLALCSPLVVLQARAQTTNPFASLASLGEEEEQLCQGTTPPKVLIDRVVAYPEEGQTTSVVLRTYNVVEKPLIDCKDNCVISKQRKDYVNLFAHHPGC
eukprot:scaffold27835_cov17-Tisochrysis_lutea.AAC.1